MTQTLPPAVRCDGIIKNYGSGDTQVQALRGVDLEVRTGELLMLVGPSGCGKTTLISILAGIMNQTSGSCSILGQNLSRLSPQELVAFRGRHLGFVFQAFNLIPSLSVLENASIPLLINGVDREAAFPRAARILAQVGLESKLQVLPGDLSGGQQQRVAIARALVHDPQLVLCDEPTSALDHQTGTRVMDILKKLALDGNRSLVIVTHDSRIYDYADRIAHLDDGRIERIEPSH